MNVRIARSTKLLLSEILPPTVKKGIYIEPNTLFIADPSHLWRIFDTLKTPSAIAIPKLPSGSLQHNSVVLLNLEELGKLRLIDSTFYGNSKPQALSSLAKASSDSTNLSINDHDIWANIYSKKPELFASFGDDFHISNCLSDKYSAGLGDESVSEEEELSRQYHLEAMYSEVNRARLLYRSNC